VKRFSALLSSALLLVAGCSREEAPARPEADLDFGPVAVSCAYIALVEKPDAARVFLLGDQAKRLAPYFERAGVRPVSDLRLGPSPSTLPAAAAVGRNDPCPCGSGKKYKKCCGKGLV